MSGPVSTNPQMRSRGLALGILVALLGSLWLAVVRPLVAAYASQRHEVDQTEQLIERFERVVAERPALELRRRALADADQAQHLTFSAESDGVAAADLQNLVKSAVERGGGALQSTQVKSPRSDNGFRRIGLRVQMTGDVEALRKTLMALEANQPLIFGESLELRARQQPKSVGKGVVEDRTLEIRLDVYSLARLPT